IGAAIVLLNEAKALLRVEELDGTCSHIGLLETHQCVRSLHNHLCRPPSGFGVFSRKALKRAGRQAGKIANSLKYRAFPSLCETHDQFCSESVHRPRREITPSSASIG